MSFEDIPDGASPEVAINEALASMGWASCYATDAAINLTALHRGYRDGRWGGFDFAGVNHTFGASVTTYVSVAVADGSINFSTSSTNFDDSTNYKRVEVVVTDASGVTDVDDYRGGPGGVHGSGGGAGAGGGGTELKGLTFTSDTGSTADSDPGNGLFKWNNGTQGSATVLFFDNQTADAVSMTTFFAALFAGNFLYLQQASDAARWQMWRITSVAAGSGYYKIGVALEAKGTDLQDDEETLCDFRGGFVDVWAFACSDRTTALTTGTNVGSMHAPYDANVIEVQAGLDTAQASGTIFTVDINEAGTTILSTKLTIDNTEDHSSTAATPAVISDNQVAKGAKISADIDQIGNGTAKGLAVYLLVSKR